MFTQTLFPKKRLVNENQIVRSPTIGVLASSMRPALATSTSTMATRTTTTRATLTVCVPSGV